MRRSTAAAVTAALALSLTLAACGGSSDSADTTTTAAAGGSAGPAECAEAAPIADGVVEGKPTEVDLPSEPTTGEVVVNVLEKGDGPKVTDTSYVTVQYLGISCASGKQFDSSWDRGDPISIAMPSAPPAETAFSVIPGWNEGLLGIPEGSLVQLDIPSDLAYGEEGRPPDIAQNDPLTFVIQVEKVSDTPPAA